MSHTSQTIRAFIAIPLPADAKDALTAAGDALAAQLPPRSVRWVKPAQMHLTLHFLGDTAVAKLPALAAALDQAAGGTPPLALALHDLGCFPNRRRPRVIWVGLRGEVAGLTALHGRIGDALAPLGWPPEERPFQPHLTLGRVNDSRQLQGRAWDASIQPVAVPVTAVHLIESQLRPGGPVYTIRHTSHLRRP